MLELKHLSYHVSSPDGENAIIDDISLTIPDGKMVVLTPIRITTASGAMRR